MIFPPPPSSSHPSTSNLILPYDPNEIEPGVIHIGFGNFAKAFVLEHFHDVAISGHKGWGVVAIAPSDRQKLELQNLARQKYIYNLIKRNGAEVCVPIGVLRDVMIAQHSPQMAILRMADAATKLVTTTITQAGYCVDMYNHFMITPQLHRDIEAIKNREFDSIQTAPGWITAALYLRYKNHNFPFTVISCDNLPHNGDLIGTIVRGMAHHIDAGFAHYLEQEGAFPNCVVDRVTPHQHYEQNREHVSTQYGVIDHMPIVCEDYRSWIIEDKFTKAGRPPLEAAGVQFVDSIDPYEDRKLRLLNGAHLALGVVSKVLQIGDVYSAANDKHVRPFIHCFLRQAAQPLADRNSAEVEQYQSDVLERLNNERMSDQVTRLLSGTTAKVGVRLYNGPALDKRLPADASAFAIAAWIRYMQGRDDSGNPYNLCAKDVGKLSELGLAETTSLPANLERFLAKAEITSPASTGIRDFTKTVLQAYESICGQGMRNALKRAFDTPSFQQYAL